VARDHRDASIRYARQVILPDVGAAGQRALGGASALVVGVGGLGCPAAQYLVTSGVGQVVLCDFDTVDESNLPRQILFRPGDVGRPKVAVAQERLLELNPAARIETVETRIDQPELVARVADADVVLDCTDNFMTRFLVNQACVEAHVPLVSGAAVRLEGQLVVFSNRGGGPCYRCLYTDEDEWLGDCQGNGVLAPVPGVIGTLMANEALGVLLGLSDERFDRLWLWDAKSAHWSCVIVKPDPSCPHCGAGRRQ
jgi:molybdopterin-synthase adenylyltransferase